MTKKLLCFTIVLGLYLGLSGFLPVFAQEEEGRDTFTLEEVTVTAEKREVNVQDLPMAVTTIAGEDIKNKTIMDLKESLLNMSGVAMMESPRGGQVFIRGIGTSMDLNQSDPSIAVNRDGIYLGGSESSFSTLYDVERVEVIKGPQGTMYGRNAAGGQVNVVTKKPVDDFEGYINASMGIYNLMNYNAAINVPIASGKLSTRFAVDQQSRDGYISDGSMDSDRFNLRGKILFTPTSRLSFLLTAEYMVDKSSGANTVPVPGSAGNLPPMPFVVPDANGDGIGDDLLSPEPEDYEPPPGPPGPPGGGGAPPGFINEPNGLVDLVDLGWEIPNGGDAWTNDIYHPRPLNDNEYKLFSLEASMDMGWSTLTVIPTLNKNRRQLWSELIMGTAMGGNLMQQPYTQTQWTAEARLQSPDDSKLIWLLGYYLWDNDNKPSMEEEAQDPYETAQEAYEDPTNPAYQAPNNPVRASWRQPQDSESYYGQATYPLTDRLRLTAGFRTSTENRDQEYRIVFWDLQDTTHPWYADTVLTDDGRHLYDTGRVMFKGKNTNTTWKGGVEYDLGEDSMIYAYYQSGYKAGGLNTGATPPTTFDPEIIDNYYLGTKNRLLDNRLQLNAEAWYYDYDGLQVSSFATVYDPIQDAYVMGGVMLNAGPSKSTGIETEFDWLITTRDKIDGNFTVMKTEYGELVLPPGNIGESGEFVLTGTDLPFAPEWSLVMGYERMFPLDVGGQLTARVQTKVSDGFWVTHEKYLAGSWQDSYATFDFYLTWNSPSGKYSASLWGKNVTNEVVNTWAMPLYRRTIGAPRTTGINFSARF